MNKEYGGYLPLELRKGNEFFEGLPLKRFNCGKAAINFVLTNKRFKKLYIPYYLCPNVLKELESHGAEVVYYNINNDLMPERILDEESSCIYLVDYFGVMDNKVKDLANSMKHASIILDFCHSFYCEPIIKKNVYNVYSAKKFFGVPDGAYLITKGLNGKEETYSFSSDYSDYLIQSLEHGTNYCYALKKEADKIIGGNYGTMSILAKRILESIEYESVKKIRKQNFKIYDSCFGKINIIKAEVESVPYMYPLNVGKSKKKELVGEKIYVPTLWSGTLDDSFKGTLEYKLSDETLFLPVDQRYNDEDIIYICKTVKKYI